MIDEANQAGIIVLKTEVGCHVREEKKSQLAE